MALSVFNFILSVDTGDNNDLFSGDAVCDYIDVHTQMLSEAEPQDEPHPTSLRLTPPRVTPPHVGSPHPTSPRLSPPLVAPHLASRPRSMSRPTPYHHTPLYVHVKWMRPGRSRFESVHVPSPHVDSPHPKRTTSITPNTANKM